MMLNFFDIDVFFSDQAIPPGLHVQINLQTGVKRAKLLEDDKNDKTHSLAIMPSNNSENNVSIFIAILMTFLYYVKHFLYTFLNMYCTNLVYPFLN